MCSCSSSYKLLSLTIAMQFLSILFAESGAAQVLDPSQSRNVYPRSSQLIFTQNLNIYEWLYSLNYHKTFANGLGFKLNEEFRSTLQRISTQDLWKDNQSFDLNFGYPLLNNVRLNAGFRSHILSDPLAGFDNDVTFYSGSAGIQMRPRQNVSVSSAITSKWQSQLERADQGFGYGLEAQLFDVNWDGYRNDFNFIAGQDFFPLRRNEDFKIRYQIKREFYQSTADTLTVFFERLRRDNFDRDSEDFFVRKLTQSVRGIENHLSYRIADDAILFLTNYLASSSFKVGNLKDDSADVRKDDAGFESKHSVHFVLKRSTWFNQMGWSFNLRSRDDRRVSPESDDPFGERHPALGFDTDEVFVKLDWSGGVKATRSDSVGWFASVSKFKYDTSDTLAPNNHDQLRWQMTLSHQHQFYPGLKLLWRGSVFLNHLVYISSRFSSGNNWERVIQLSPSILYEPSRSFTFLQSFTVRAKYQTYDFDDPISSTRNIANRQFIMSNNTSIAVTAQTKIELSAAFELAEQGRFFYENWRQQLALSWWNQDIELLIKNALTRQLTISAGGNFFHQIRWNHRADSQGRLRKFVRDKHTNVGPLLEFFFRPSSSLELAFMGNIQFVYSSQRQTEHINRFDLNLNWFF